MLRRPMVSQELLVYDSTASRNFGLGDHLLLSPTEHQFAIKSIEKG
ncbi:MAG: hypothetical protein JSS65_04790 [Armatimonadetes bacterium]|nr:hypothetical protein [Armatimonadota bacterium]